MIIQLQDDVSDEQVSAVTERVGALGFKANQVRTQKGHYLVAIGKGECDLRFIGHLPGVNMRADQPVFESSPSKVQPQNRKRVYRCQFTVRSPTYRLVALLRFPLTSSGVDQNGFVHAVALGKHLSNIESHALDFAECDAIWDNFTVTREDVRQDYGEKRLVTFGLLHGEAVVLVYVDEEVRHQ